MSVIAASDPELLEPQQIQRRTPQEIDPQEVERRTQEWGQKLFDLMESVGEVSLFTAKGLYGALMDWAMKDEQFKVHLFRFVDVLPTLRSSGEISRHLKEYLDNDQVKLSPALRTALKATGFAGGLLGGSIKGQVTNMARMFMLGDAPKEIVSILNKLREEGAGFTLDVLGEAVVSEKEAEEYAARYMNLLELLGQETAKWDKPARSDVTPEGEVPRLNVSVKISAFYSQIQATDFEGAIVKLSERLRPILRRAKELGAFINFDMESYAVKELTLELFKRIFAETEFASGPACGLAMQAYLKDCERDLHGIVEWARAYHRRVTVRLVKGAYWDYETVIARQRRWPVPVFEHKPETDANFEKLSSYLLANSDIVSPALASHNVRSLAHVLAQAEAMGLDMRSFEFQVLYGMGDSIRKALLQAGCRVRVYCPVGELLPGMAYLVRRLLENTSNEGFIAQKFARGASREALLRNPAELPADTTGASPVPAEPQTVGLPEFKNEPPTDFTLSTEREKLGAALKEVRASFGRRHPLVIGGKPVLTENWAASLNPANQKEIIGHSARGCVADAEAALEAARSAQAKWGRTSAEERGRMLTKLGDLLRRDKSVITALMVFEAGKTWSESDADVAEAIDFCNFNGAAARELGRPKADANCARGIELPGMVAARSRGSDSAVEFSAGDPDRDDERGGGDGKYGHLEAVGADGGAGGEDGGPGDGSGFPRRGDQPADRAGLADRSAPGGASGSKLYRVHGFDGGRPGNLGNGGANARGAGGVEAGDLRDGGQERGDHRQRRGSGRGGGGQCAVGVRVCGAKVQRVVAIDCVAG